ncbi:HNH endonuclease [Vreelandella venusta]|uniref:HNH endonuclease n=1 Tax=Vreelandella venusta TaxID=44935 RepID=UPI00384F2081
MKDDTLTCLTTLRVGRSRNQLAANKPCLLLAVICEIQSRHISTPHVSIDDRLLSRYFDLYETATGNRRAANPHLPLWHLKSDRGASGAIWKPIFNSSVSKVAQSLGQPKSLSKLLDLFAEAKLDSALFSAFQNKQTAHEACALIVANYFASPAQQHALNTYLATALESGEYEKQPDRLVGEVKETAQQQARSAAFRMLVLEAYDYRCAATRLRFITPDYRYLVEAAHLIPFASSHDDRPTNGLALTPDLHWAMDNHLIAPGPDHKWHISPTLDDLMPDNAWLQQLDGQAVVLPRAKHRQPCQQALAWRLDNLLR